MDTKVLQFDKSARLYKKVAQKKQADGDLIGCLNTYFSAYSQTRDIEILLDIAEVYIQMEELDSSNQYLYYYLGSEENSNNARAYCLLAKNLYNLGDMANAIQYYDIALQLDVNVFDFELEEQLSKEFAEYEKRKPIRQVYPITANSYKLEREIAEKFMYSHDMAKAQALYSMLPIEALTLSECEKYFYVCEMTGQLEQAKKVLKHMKQKFGENFTTCVASCIYNVAESNLERANYHYAKALSLKEENEDCYLKILNCSGELQDGQTSKSMLVKLLALRPYDALFHYYYALLMLWDNDFDNAKRLFVKAYKLCPDNYVFEFYAKKCLEGDYKTLLRTEDRRLVVGLPSQIEDEIENEIKKTVKRGTKREFKYGFDIHLNTTLDLAVDGLIFFMYEHKDLDIKKYNEIMLKYLLKPYENHAVKSTIIYLLVLDDAKRDFAVCQDNSFMWITPSKIRVSKRQGLEYLRAYASIIYQKEYWSEEKNKEVCTVINGLFARAKKNKIVMEYSEICCLSYYFLLGKSPEMLKELCKHYELDNEQIKQLLDDIMR